MRLQDDCFTANGVDEKRLSLFLRYQTTNDRAFHKSLNDLLKLRAEKRRAQIGFESQKRKEAEELRREATENRKQDLHGMAVLLAEAKADHQLVLNLELETLLAGKFHPRKPLREGGITEQEPSASRNHATSVSAHNRSKSHFSLQCL